MDIFLNLKKSIEENSCDIDITEIEIIIKKLKTSVFELKNLENYLLCVYVMEEIEKLLILKRILKNGS
jgi:hypothetical protein